MPLSVAVISGLLVFAAICALAWVKGGPSERAGATVLVLATLANIVVHKLAPPDMHHFLLLGLDGLIAMSFLFLALRHMSLWLGGAMLLQAGQFSLHAYYLVTEQPHDRVYAMVNNLVSYGLLLCILTGTLLAWRSRSRAAK